MGGDQYEEHEIPAQTERRTEQAVFRRSPPSKGSSGIGGSEPASEPGGNPMSKKKTEENEISNPLRSDFCSFNERFGVSRKENNDSFFKQLM